MNSLVVSVMNFLLVAAGTAFVWILLAALVGDFAERKGHSGYLWVGLSLICSPLVGFIAVALLPFRTGSGPVWYQPCPYCLKTVEVGSTTCPYCKADLAGKTKAEKRAA